jgi:hypothetical protein
VKACVFAQQNFNIDAFVFQDSFIIGQVHDTKSASIKDRGDGPIWEDDFGFNVDGFPAFAS